MARFFRYKSAKELTAAAVELNSPVRLQSDLSPLARPIDVDGRRIGNRLAIQPMEGCDATADGAPDELVFRRFERFGRGGAKLIWGEAAAVVLDGRANPRQLCVREENLSGLAKLPAACRKAHRESIGDDGDLLIGLQLTHSGRYSFARPVLAMHCPVLDRRTWVDKAAGVSAVEPHPLISDDELKRLADAYALAARRAFACGFDFVDVKQCHRYLLSELLAARTRPGPYGGSIANRARFVLELVRRIKDENPRGMVATRINVYDGVPYRTGKDGVGEPEPRPDSFAAGFGVDPSNPLKLDLAEPLQVVDWLADAGVKLVNVSMGCPYYNPHVIRPAEQPPSDGYLPPENPLIGVGRHFFAAEAVQKRRPDVAVVGSGYSYLQDYLFEAGPHNVAAGRVSFVGLGRASLSYPHSPRDVLGGRPLDRKSICRTFSFCTTLMRSKRHPLGQFPTGCPPFDKDVYGPIWKEAQESESGRVSP